MDNQPESVPPAQASIDQLVTNLEAYKAKVQSAIETFEANVDEIDCLGSELTAFEESDYFKGLSEHSHQQLMLDLREYTRSLYQAGERLQAKIGQAKYNQQLTVDVEKLAVEVGELDQQSEV